jgi:hypothetical protein
VRYYYCTAAITFWQNENMDITTQVRGGERILNELGRLLKLVSGTPGTPSGDVK